MNGPLTYFVSPLGDDTTGLSASAAFHTIQQAANLVNPGDTVEVMSGTYTSAGTGNPNQVVWITHSGTAAAPITFEAAPGQHPIIDVTGVNEGIQIEGAAYIVISGFEVVGDAQSISLAYAQSVETSLSNPLTNEIGIGVGNWPDNTAHHITIENNTVHDLPGSGIVTSHADYITVTGNTVYDNAFWSPSGGSGISIFESTDIDGNTGYKTVVSNNIVYGNHEYIPYLYSGTISDGNGIIIDSNLHQNSDHLAYQGKTLVDNNIIFNNGGSGAHAYSSHNVDFISNTAYLNQAGPQLGAQSSQNINILNNIMVAGATPLLLWDAASTNVVYDYNILDADANTQPRGAHDIVGDPQFVNPSVDPQLANFQLMATSPAVGTALVIQPASVLGVLQPIGEQPDRGALQHQGPPSPPVIQSLASPTFNPEPTLTGSAAANSTITVFDGTASLGTTTASGTGTWSFTPTSPLAVGSHSFTATAANASGTSAASAAVAEQIDADVAPSIAALTSPTTNPEPVLSGTAPPGTQVTIYDGVVRLGAAMATGSGAWTFTPAVPLAIGNHSFTATATDAVGTASAISAAVTEEIIAGSGPPAPTINPLAGPTYTADPTLTGTAKGNATVTVYDGTAALGSTTATAGGAWTFTPASPLAAGLHSFTATASDASGTSAASGPVSERITMLVLQVSGDPWNGAPQFTVDVNGQQVGGIQNATASHAQGQWGSFTFVGDYGLSGPQSVAVNFINDAYGGPGQDRNLYVASLSVDGQLYPGAAAADNASLGYTSPDAALMLVDGTVTFSLSAGSPPPAPAINALASPSFAAEPTITGTAAANATIAVFDGATQLGTTTASAAGGWSFTPAAPLAIGAHSFTATASNANGTSAASAAVAEQIDADTAPIIAALASPTTNTEPPLSGTAPPNTTVTIYDGATKLGTATATSAGAWGFTPASPLALGLHSFTATATDANGTVSPSSAAVSEQIVAGSTPPPPVINAFAGPTYTADPTLTGTAEANATVTVYDGATALGTTTATAAGAWSFTPASPLAVGLHSFTATATDASGTSAASAALTERITALVLQVSGDSWNGAPQFTVDVNGQQVGGVESTTAAHSQGQWDTFTFVGDFGLNGPQSVAVNFINDAFGGSGQDRNLYVASLSVDGQLYPGSGAADDASLGYTNPNAALMLVNGTVTFSPTPLSS